jgi:hypothetical protein
MTQLKALDVIKKTVDAFKKELYLLSVFNKLIGYVHVVFQICYLACSHQHMDFFLFC